MNSAIEALAIQALERREVYAGLKTTEGKELPPIQELPESKEDVGKLVIEKPDIAFIERTTRLALFEGNAASGEKIRNDSEGTAESDSTEKKRLTDEEKAKIKDETGWSDEIIDSIQSIKQYEILKNASLKEVEINGRKCLIKENINLDYADADGITNRDRIALGLAPLDNKSGKTIELHHLGQKKDSPLVELTEEEHRTGEFENGKKNQSLWHDNSIETEVHSEGNMWNEERKTHWKARAEQLSGGNN